MIFIDWPAVYQSLASSIFMALFLLLSGLFVSFMQKIRYFWIMLYTVVVKSILTIWHCAIIRERQKSLGNWTGLYILPSLELNLRLGADSWKLFLFVVFCSHSAIDLPTNTSHLQLLFVHFFCFIIIIFFFFQLLALGITIAHNLTLSLLCHTNPLHFPSLHESSLWSSPLSSCLAAPIYPLSLSRTGPTFFLWICLQINQPELSLWCANF